MSQTLDSVAAVLRPRLRGVLHAGAFVVSISTGTVLVCLADSARARVAVAIYAASVTLLFGTSALYHRKAWSPRLGSWLQRLDHSMIFVLIAGTYTPFALLVLRGTASVVVLSVVWGGAVIGITLRLLWRRPRMWVFVPLYLALGWVAVFVLPDLLRHAGVAVFVLLLVGGALYSLGAVVYATRRPN